MEDNKMMVIQSTSNETGSKMIFPAALCSWEQVEDAGSVSIDNVWFHTGGTHRLNLSSGKGSVLLGYIGKSGRFIAIGE